MPHHGRCHLIQVAELRGQPATEQIRLELDIAFSVFHFAEFSGNVTRKRVAGKPEFPRYLFKTAQLCGRMAVQSIGAKQETPCETRKKTELAWHAAGKLIVIEKAEEVLVGGATFYQVRQTS